MAIEKRQLIARLSSIVDSGPSFRYVVRDEGGRRASDTDRSALLMGTRSAPTAPAFAFMALIEDKACSSAGASTVCRIVVGGKDR